MTPPRISTVVVNTTDVHQLATFWAGLLQVEAPEHTPGSTMVRIPTDATSGVTLAFQQVDEVAGHTQTHLDIEVDDLDETQAQFEALGGALVKINKLASGFEWRVCADPHGNEFCIFTRHP